MKSTSTPEQELSAYPELLRSLLINRSIDTTEKAERFLNPDYEEHLHDPFLMQDMEKAVMRVLSAMEARERIVVYSDYDCDGIPGGVLLHTLFKKIGYTNAFNYIPHRHEEGYGLNIGAIDKLFAEGTKLLITVDCGITDVEQVGHAQKLGMDVIVTDHHMPGMELPPAFAVVNPKREGNVYPDPMLCGSGVAFKLSQGILSRGDFKLSTGWEKWLLDMAGLATIADMVPLTGENRVIAHFGLKVLRKSPRPGLQKLCRKMRMDQRYLTEDDIGYMIAPRINAASRMDEPMQAFNLLSTTDEGEAGALADHLNKINDVRKGLVASMSKDIKKRLGALGEPREVIVMGDPRWRPALLGLTANTLMEEYQRPVFLWGREGGASVLAGGVQVLKGSCRSDGSVDVVELMLHAKDVFLGSGGHALAGGFSLLQDMVHHLEERLIHSYEKLKRSVAAYAPYTIDAELSLENVSRETYALIERMAPFGEGNPKPVFLFPKVVVASLKQFGKNKEHLGISFERPGSTVEAISFFTKPEKFPKPVAEGSRVDLVASIEKSYFGGAPKLRLRIVDIV